MEMPLGWGRLTGARHPSLAFHLGLRGSSSPCSGEENPFLPAEGSLDQRTDRPGGMSKMGPETLAMERLLHGLWKSIISALRLKSSL